MSLQNWLTLHWQDLGGLVWLLAWWLGYATFAQRRAARGVVCIASVLHEHRISWMRALLQRENRIADAALLANLERNASFLASTSIFVIAGVFTLLASVEKVRDMVVAVPLVAVDVSSLQLQFKILVLLLIHVYAFFTFTWSMRQYGFSAILLGAAPAKDEPAAQAENYVQHVARVIDQAGMSYNFGLRAFYFSLAVLAWLLSAWVFVAAVTLIVAVLYGREFHSPTLKDMLGATPSN